MAGQVFGKFLPLFDRIFVTKRVARNLFLLLLLQETVVAVGSVSKGKGAEIQPISVKVGDKVLLAEYEGTKVVLEDKYYSLFRHGDILRMYVD
ncbi:unnamed protein product [Nyctereutes procyonoides]|uniref:(raccoon dog) hypothetical protein n=1 Tax=Nyctereutes procyonoides TaxID=34880 RepID=A0A811XV44_NYCPR|nr:unnamed protein product [Nyctereutes procyonoides]